MIEGRERLSLATRLFKTHRVSPEIAFWTADDWSVMHHAVAVRTSPESVTIKVREVGVAGLTPRTTWS